MHRSYNLMCAEAPPQRRKLQTLSAYKLFWPSKWGAGITGGPRAPAATAPPPGYAGNPPAGATAPPASPAPPPCDVPASPSPAMVPSPGAAAPSTAAIAPPPAGGVPPAAPVPMPQQPSSPEPLQRPPAAVPPASPPTATWLAHQRQICSLAFHSWRRAATTAEMRASVGNHQRCSAASQVGG